MCSRILLNIIRYKDAIHISNEVSRLMIHSFCKKNPDLFVIRPLVTKYCSDCPPKCWKCEFPYKSELFCSKCKSVQKPPENLNYFDLIGIKEDYDIASEQVQKKYRQLQTMLHPDRFGNRSEKERAISENFSSLLNRAYKTLMNPLERGLYMLKLHNASISEDTTQLNSEFLMMIMEKNEEVEEASEDKEKVIELVKENKEKLSSLSKEISKAFHDTDIDKAKVLLAKMKYYTSINIRLKKLKNELGIFE